MNNTCPKCQTPIKVSDIMQAGLPNMIKCAKCKSSIKFNVDSTLLYSVSVLTIVLALLVSLGLANFLQQALFAEMKRLIIWLPLAFVFTIVAEYVMAKWLLNTKGVDQQDTQ